VGIPALILVGRFVQPGALISIQGIATRILMSYVVNSFTVFFTVALPEEIGWRGFALPHMQPRYGPLGGTLRLGALWLYSRWFGLLHNPAEHCN
jgi:uncharacterized protein